MARYLSFIFILLLAASCKKAELQDVVSVNDSGKLLIQADIASVNGPTTATPDKEITFNVAWPHTGDHHAFNTFQTDTINKNTYNIKLFVDASSCASCHPDTAAHTSVFKFRPTRSGVYYLKFYSKDTTQLITDTLVVK